MRFRLLLVLSAFSVAAVAAFALPLLGSTAAERTQRFVLERTADMDRFAALAQQQAGGGTIVREVQAYTALYGEGVVVVDRTGSPVVESGLRAAEPGVAAAIDAALRNQPANRPDRLGPWSTDPLLLSRPVGTGTQVGGAVVLRASPAAAATDIAASWTVVLIGALTAAIVFAAVARWVLRPVAELAGGVRAVAAGRPGAHVSPHAGPPELRELAAAFNRMSDAVSTSAEQQRRLVADTSHQLRNPLAALRLRVDTLESHVGAAGAGTYRSTIAEVDRLEALLDGLLDLASAESRATDVAAGGGSGAAADVPAVVAERITLWAPVGARAGVAVECVDGPAAEAACAASELAQVLDVVLDNAVKYAGGGAAVQVGWRVEGATVVLTVRDDGPGIAPADLPLATQRFWRSSRAARHRARGTGLGLAIAEQLVGARDGRLRLDGAPGGGLLVRVELPCAP